MITGKENAGVITGTVRGKLEVTSVRKKLGMITGKEKAGSTGKEETRRAGGDYR